MIPKVSVNLVDCDIDYLNINIRQSDLKEVTGLNCVKKRFGYDYKTTTNRNVANVKRVIRDGNVSAEWRDTKRIVVKP